jgi:hypothetical protein
MYGLSNFGELRMGSRKTSVGIRTCRVPYVLNTGGLVM